MKSPNLAVDEIRKLKAHHLLVTVEGDETPRKVSVPNVRNRWDRVSTLLDSMRWTHIEARSKDGGTLAMLEPEADATSSSENRTDRPTDDVQTIRERDLLDLLERSNDRAVARALEAQQVGSARYEQMMQLVFEGVHGILTNLAASTRAVVAQYSQAMTLQASTTSTGAGDAGGLGDLAPLLHTMRELHAGGAKGKAPAKPAVKGKAVSS